MVANVIIYALMLLGTIIQFTLPIAENVTLLNYFIIVLVIVSRVAFGIRLISIEVPVPVIMVFEGLGFGFSFVFLLSSFYKHSFEMYWGNVIAVSLISIAFLIGVFVESQTIVYVTEEDTDDV